VPSGEKIVLAYMSIGEAEEYRFYRKSGWRPGNPSWLHDENPDWSGNYKVHYGEAAWQDIILQYVDRLLDAGFRGEYLDLVDAYVHYRNRGRAMAAVETVRLVGRIAERVRARDPGVVILIQNAAELAGAFPEILEIVDGVGQEDIHYGYVDEDVMTPVTVTDETKSWLDVFLHAGKP